MNFGPALVGVHVIARLKKQAKSAESGVVADFIAQLNLSMETMTVGYPNENDNGFHSCFSIVCQELTMKNLLTKMRQASILGHRTVYLVGPGGDAACKVRQFRKTLVPQDVDCTPAAVAGTAIHDHFFVLR